MHSYPYVLKEPGPHHIGSMLRQDAPLVLGGAIFLMQDAEILIQLQLKLSHSGQIMSARLFEMTTHQAAYSFR